MICLQFYAVNCSSNNFMYIRSKRTKCSGSMYKLSRLSLTAIKWPSSSLSLTQVAENGAQFADVDGPVSAVVEYVERVRDSCGRTSGRRRQPGRGHRLRSGSARYRLYRRRRRDNRCRRVRYSRIRRRGHVLSVAGHNIITRYSNRGCTSETVGGGRCSDVRP